MANLQITHRQCADHRSVNNTSLAIESLSAQLVSHPGLITPLLHQLFGHIYVEACHTIDGAGIIDRRSTIRQTGSNIEILSASIIIHTAAMPSSLLTRLMSTDIPFGQLLLDHHLMTKIADLESFRFDSILDQSSCYGRSHSILCSTTERTTPEVLCRVTEYLNNEQALETAQQYLSDHIATTS